MMEKTLESLMLDIKADGDEKAAVEDTGNVEEGAAEGGQVILDGEGEEAGASAAPDESSEAEGPETGASNEEQGSEGDSMGSEEEDEGFSFSNEEWNFDEGDESNEEPQVNLEALKEVVGEEVKDVDGLKEYVSTIKTELDEAKAAAADKSLDTLPESLKEAIEIAKEGSGDYLELLKINSVDYTALDPATLAESELRQHFVNSDGTFDEDGWVEYIDNIPEKELEIKGKQRISQLEHEKELRKQQFYAKVKQDQILKQAEIVSAVTKMDKVADFKVNDGVKNNLAKTLSTSVNDVLMPKTQDGKTDWDSVARNVFLVQNFNKMYSAMKTKVNNKVKGDFIKEVGNHTVDGKSDKSVHTPDGKQNPLDLFIQSSKERAQRNQIHTYHEQNK